MSSPSSLWLTTLTLMIGTLAAVMGASTVNTALPDIMSGLAISPDQLSWVATSYMLANVVAIPSAAWCGQVLSKRVLFGVGVASFLVASVMCGLSTSFEAMILFRVVQGLAGGLIIPTAQAMIFEAFPPDQRGLGMGIFGMGAIMGPALGPTIGGYLVELFNWRAIFFINIPFGLVSLALLGTLPRAPRRTDLAFDAPGFVSMALGLATLQIAVTNGSKDGWDAPYIMGCMLAAVASLGYMFVRELTTPKPLLDLRVFKYPLYNGASIVSAILGLGLFGSTFLVPIYMGTVLGYTALQIGLVLLPGSLVMGVAMLVAGRLSDLIDGRILLAIGLSIFAYGLWIEALADASSPTSLYVWAQVWRGLGMALCFSPLTAISLRGMPPELIAQATGIFNLTRQLAGSIGIALINTLLTARTSHHAAVIGQAMGAHEPQTRAFLAAAEATLRARGMAPGQATQGAFAMLGGQVRQQVAVLAYADLFLLCMAIVIAGLLPVLFLRAGSPRAAAAR